MRIGDFLYFSPGVPFSQLSLSDPQLGKLWEDRIEGYYLLPAETLLASGYVFAAGLLLVSAIDAMSRYESAPRRVGARRVGSEFRAFVEQELPSFADAQAAAALYDRYRNGLAHEARLKDGAEFALDQPSTFSYIGQLVRIDPHHLLLEVRAALRRFVATIAADSEARAQFARLLERDFSYELTGTRAPATAG